MRRALFICTGNYYRSRFAEAVFNHRAAAEQLPWSAFSRGLAIELAEGDLSVHTRDALRRRGIDPGYTGPTRVQLVETDLQQAQLRIALADAEHRPMVTERFPHWEARIEFWDVADDDLCHPDEALPRIEARVLELLARLREG